MSISEPSDLDDKVDEMGIHYQDEALTLLHGDALEMSRTLPDASAQAIVTSPPYYQLRDYGVDGQYGLEETPAAYVEKLRALFAELKRVLADDGTLWLNLGDTYNAYNGNRGEGGLLNSGERHAMLAKQPKGSGLTDKSLPNKSLLGIPWRVAISLQDDGWILRNSIIWHKPNSKPGGGKDRFVARHENVFMFSKKQKYFFDADHRLEGDVWKIPVSNAKRAHSAIMPTTLADKCILAGSKEGQVVLDPFTGSGTTGLAAERLGRNYVGIDLSRQFLEQHVNEARPDMDSEVA